MDQDLSHQDDLRARRDAMRERLRLQAERVLEAVEDMGDPKSFLEVERAARAIIATDKMFEQVFSKPKATSFDRRFGVEDYDEREPSRSQNLHVYKTVDAPIVASGDTSPVTQGKMTGAVTSGAEIKIPVSGRLTKRQKRRLRAHQVQAPSAGHGVGSSP